MGYDVEGETKTIPKYTHHSVKIPKYFFFSVGWYLENSENVIKLAKDAIIVPVPPMLTPSKSDL